MAEYQITKTIVATLVVDCETATQAHEWAERIVGTLETSEGSAIQPHQVNEFVAESRPDKLVIERLS